MILTTKEKEEMNLMPSNKCITRNPKKLSEMKERQPNYNSGHISLSSPSDVGSWERVYDPSP